MGIELKYIKKKLFFVYSLIYNLLIQIDVSYLSKKE